MAGEIDLNQGPAQPTYAVDPTTRQPIPGGGGGTVTLGAGSAIAGKVGIDQTTPGTTNGVAVLSTVNTPLIGVDGATIASDSNPVPSQQAALAAGTDQVSIGARGSGGWTGGHVKSAANTTGINIKASAGTLSYLNLTNHNASARFVKLYNKASAPTVGTDTPIHCFEVPGGTTGAGSNLTLPAGGIAFSLGIGIGITTGEADNDTGAPAALEVIANYAYA